MTKRPKAFVAVVMWVGLFMLASLIPMTRMLTGYSGPATDAPTHFVVTEVMVLGFTVVLIVSLVRLLPAAIWLTVGFLTLSAVSALLRLPTLISSASTPFMLIPAIAGCGLSATCAWYLSRRSFHASAEQVRTEREQEAKRRHAERRVRREANSRDSAA